MNNTTDNFWNDDLVKEYTHDVIIKALNERTISPRTWDEQILKFRQSKLQQPKPTDNFQWDDELVKKFTDYYNSTDTTNLSPNKIISYFKQLQQSKRIEVADMYQMYINQDVSKKTFLRISFNIESIPNDKYSEIKKAIEKILNNEVFDTDKINDRIKQLEEMENVWNAARKFTGGTAQNTFYDIASQLKYKTFQDYQQSLPENKPETHTTSNASLKCQNEEKPILGVMPLWLWKEQRLKEVNAAIERCKELGKEIPQIWLDEQYLLTIK